MKIKAIPIGFKNEQIFEISAQELFEQLALEEFMELINIPKKQPAEEVCKCEEPNKGWILYFADKLKLWCFNCHKPLPEKPKQEVKEIEPLEKMTCISLIKDDKEYVALEKQALYRNILKVDELIQVINKIKK